MRIEIELTAVVPGQKPGAENERRVVLGRVPLTVEPNLATVTVPIEVVHVDLTFRERQVLDRMLRGMVHKEIAAELGVSVTTVKSHARTLYRKHGVKSRASLIFKTAVPKGKNE